MSNYTPVDHLVDAMKPQQVGASYHPEHPSFTKKEVTAPEEIIEFNEVADEVKPHVEVKPETIKVSVELQSAGVKPVESTTYAQSVPLQLPLSDEKIVEGMNAPVTSSFRWLATFAIFLLHQAHFTIKRIQGKPVRVPLK